MSTPPEPLCPVTVLRCATIYSRRHVPHRLAHLRDDIASGATVRVMERVSQGHMITTSLWRWAITDEMRSMCGDYRTRKGRSRAGAHHVDPDTLTTDSDAGDLGWCVSRLRDAWPSLTEDQRRSVTHWLLDEVTPGIHPSAACRHRAAAFQRVRERRAA